MKIDRIEYDVTRLKCLTYKMASVRVRACVRACAIEIKQGMLHAVASMIYAFGRAYGLPYKMATFHSKKELLNTVYCGNLTIMVLVYAFPCVLVIVLRSRHDIVKT